MSDLDDLEKISDSVKFRTSAAPDENAKRAPNFRKRRFSYGREREYFFLSTRKITLPKLKFLEGSDE